MPTSKKLGKSASKKKVIGRRVSASVAKKPRKKYAKLSKRFVFVFLGGAVALLIGTISFNALYKEPFCANSISCIKDLTGVYDSQAKSAIYEGKIVKIPVQEAIAYVEPAKNVLGESTGSKKITVDLSSQRLYAYEGDRVVMDFPVSTGKWNHTPTGTFKIWVKLRYTKMEGGNKAAGTYYYLPNVPYTMFYSNNEVSKSAGYSIHGAYWHDNFGVPMSHGCVNMRIADAGQVFTWAHPTTVGWANPATTDNPGTEVVVYGQTPLAK